MGRLGYLLVLLVVCSTMSLAQQLRKKKIEFKISNGVQIAGIDGTNPVIYDNDLLIDSPDVFYLWLKANKGEVKLVGNISSRDMDGVPNYINSHDYTFSQWTDLYDRAMKSKLKNIPAPVKGSEVALEKPANGIIEDTKFEASVGSDLIIAEAHKASPDKPLCIFVGGNVTSIANAYLKDKSIADRVVVFHVGGYKFNQGTYNTIDSWSTYIVMKKFRYINWSGDLYSWYDNVRPLNVDLTGMPDTPFTEVIKYWYGAAFKEWKDLGDAPPILYFFDHSLWKNLAFKLEDRDGTSSSYDFLLVSENDWKNYGRVLSDVLKNPSSYQ